MGTSTVTSPYPTRNRVRDGRKAHPAARPPIPQLPETQVPALFHLSIESSIDAAHLVPSEPPPPCLGIGPYSLHAAATAFCGSCGGDAPAGSSAWSSGTIAQL